MDTGRTRIRMGGYGPPTTTFSRALKRIGDALEAALGGRVEVRYVWNIMDLGYRAEDILWLVEEGLLTLGYQSSSYLTDRIPELGVLDLPFVFPSAEHARAAIDGALGRRLAGRIEGAANYRVLGFLENGFRHISNRLRPVRTPAQLAGMRMRILPSLVHERTFALMGAVPMRMDLTEAIAMIAAGTLDAQENPLANSVTYGIHKFHRFHTLTSHFYVSRPVFVHRTAFERWPDDLKAAMCSAVTQAVARQREDHAHEERAALAAVLAAGCQVEQLSAAEQEAFASAVRPIYGEARARFGEEFLSLARGSGPP